MVFDKKAYLIEWRKQNHSHCVEYQKEYNANHHDEQVQKRKVYYALNKEKISIRDKPMHKAYWAKNRDKLCAQKRQHYRENPEKMKLQRKRNYEKHKTSILAKQKIYNEGRKEELKAYKKSWYEKNKTELLAESKIRYVQKKDLILTQVKKRASGLKKEKAEYDKKYVKANYAKINVRVKKYNILNHDKILKRNLAWVKQKRKTDVLFKLKKVMLSRVNHLIEKRYRHIDDLLNFSFPELKAHLEKQFTPKMSWANYGTYWQVDHIVPCSWFCNELQLLKYGFRLSNLQPLERILNISKGDRYVFNMQKNPICEAIYLLPAPKEVN